MSIPLTLLLVSALSASNATTITVRSSEKDSFSHNKKENTVAGAWVEISKTTEFDRADRLYLDQTDADGQCVTDKLTPQVNPNLRDAYIRVSTDPNKPPVLRGRTAEFHWTNKGGHPTDVRLTFPLRKRTEARRAIETTRPVLVWAERWVWDPTIGWYVEQYQVYRSMPTCVSRDGASGTQGYQVYRSVPTSVSRDGAAGTQGTVTVRWPTCDRASQVPAYYSHQPVYQPAYCPPPSLLWWLGF